MQGADVCAGYVSVWAPNWAPSHTGVNPQNTGTRPGGRGIPMSILPRDVGMTFATASTLG